MPFDLLIYSKIKQNYKQNVKAFKELGDKKISFDGQSGIFKAESNLARTFASNKEGTTASSVAGFLYPVSALCHRACYKGLLSLKNKAKYKEDLENIEKALNGLKKTYQKQWIKKDSQIQNVEEAIFTCEVQIKILNAFDGDRHTRGDYVSFCHKEFFRAANLDFKPLIAQFQDILDFMAVDQDFYNKILKVVEDGSLQESWKDEAEARYINAEFLKKVDEIGKYLYGKKYAEAKDDPGNLITPREYKEEMTEAKRMSAYGANYPSSAMHYQGCKSTDDANARRRDGTHINKGNFLWFRKAAYNGKTENRIYLNVNPNLNAHKTVLTELLNVLSDARWKDFIGHFKFTHLGSIRNDTVCIYGSEAKKMEDFAAAISKTVNITTNLRPNVANLQKQLFPGVGIGMGAEPGNWELAPGKKDTMRWSYGTHRCFLVSWAAIRTGRDGVNWGDESYNDIILFKTAEIFADNGIDVKDIHASVMLFENTMIGQLVKNLRDRR